MNMNMNMTLIFVISPIVSMNMNHTGPVVASVSNYLEYSADRWYFTFWGCVVANGAFWGANLFFFIIDRLGLFSKYKVRLF